MNIERLCVLYFSPTGGTEKIAHVVAGELGERLGLEPEYIPFTRPEERREYRFGPADLLVMASPVYAGRLPNKLLPEYREKIFGENTPAVPLCVFGNRNYDEALRELALLLEGNGFVLAAAAAFPGRHAFSDKVGEGRPDWDDTVQEKSFAARTAEKLAGEALAPLSFDRGEIGPYYTPLKMDGTPAKFLKAKPMTRWEKCCQCGACVRACPMGSIDPASKDAVGLCIKCQACVRKCTRKAKYFDDPEFLSHVAMLEQHYAARAEGTMWLD